MANTKLLEREIHNLAQAKARRITIYLAVGGETSADAVDAVGDSGSAGGGRTEGLQARPLRLVGRRLGRAGLRPRLRRFDARQ